MNNQCCMSWDQRVPNEPIFERNFLIHQPPIISMDRPRNTDMCSLGHMDDPWLLLSDQQEKCSANYWCNSTNLNGHANNLCSDMGGISAGVIGGVGTGLMTRCLVPNTPMPTDTETAAARPWVHGIKKNINSDSILKNLNYYDPRDIIVPPYRTMLNNANAQSDKHMRKAMIAMSQPLQTSASLSSWKNVTSPRMLQSPYDAHSESLANMKYYQ